MDIFRRKLLEQLNSSTNVPQEEDDKLTQELNQVSQTELNSPETSKG